MSVSAPRPIREELLPVPVLSALVRSSVASRSLPTAGASSCTAGTTCRATLTWRLSLESGNAAAVSHLIEICLLLRLHRSDVQNSDRISVTQSRHHFRYIVIRNSESHDFRSVLAGLDDENHSAASLRALTAGKTSGLLSTSLLR